MLQFSPTKNTSEEAIFLTEWCIFLTQRVWKIFYCVQFWVTYYQKDRWGVPKEDDQGYLKLEHLPWGRRELGLLRRKKRWLQRGGWGGVWLRATLKLTSCSEIQLHAHVSGRLISGEPGPRSCWHKSRVPQVLSSPGPLSLSLWMGKNTTPFFTFVSICLSLSLSVCSVCSVCSVSKAAD